MFLFTSFSVIIRKIKIKDVTQYLYCSWAALKSFLNTAVRALHLKCQSFSLLDPDPPEALHLTQEGEASLFSGLQGPV